MMTDWWQEPIDAVVSAGFDYDGPDNIGGSYDKHFFKSKKNGHKYLWKSGQRKIGLLSKAGNPRASTSADKAFTAPNAEDFGTKIASKVLNHGEYIPMTKMEFPFDIEGVDKGTLGIIMPFISDAKPNTFDLEKSDWISKLTVSDIKTIQRLHIVDYIISNLDTHGETTIRVNDKLIGIDRGQSLRYMSNVLRATKPGMGEDTLDRLSTPVGAKSVYSEFFKAARDGKIQVKRESVEDIIKKIESLSDKEFIDDMSDYLESFKDKYLISMKSAARGKPGNKTYWKGLSSDEIQDDIEGIVKKMIDRKNNIRNAVDNFYNKIEKNKKESVTSIEEGSREIGLTPMSIRQETEDVIDSLLADTIKYVGSDSNIFHDSSDVIDASNAALSGKNPSKAFYYKCLSRAMDNDDISEEGILKSANKYASHLKGLVDDRIGETLSKEDLFALEDVKYKEMLQWLDEAFEKKDLILVIIVMAGLGIKKKMNKIFISDD
jgi:hypothetical protein